MKLAFYKASGGTYDKLVRIVTHGPYSHCELVFTNGDWFSSSPRDGGVRFKVIDPKPDAWDFLELGAIPEKPIRDWCNTQVGLGYDWTGVARFVLPFMRPSKHRWFCSEICIAALQKGGDFTSLEPFKYSPNSLYETAKRVSSQLPRY